MRADRQTEKQTDRQTNKQTTGGEVTMLWTRDVDRSSSKVALSTWTRVTISRHGRDGSLRVNDDAPTVGRSRGRSTQLNVPMRLYVGGLPRIPNPGSGVTSGFIGAIQRVGENHVCCQRWS